MLGTLDNRFLIESWLFRKKNVKVKYLMLLSKFVKFALSMLRIIILTRTLIEAVFVIDKTLKSYVFIVFSVLLYMFVRIISTRYDEHHIGINPFMVKQSDDFLTKLEKEFKITLYEKELDEKQLEASSINSRDIVMVVFAICTAYIINSDVPLRNSQAIIGTATITLMYLANALALSYAYSEYITHLMITFTIDSYEVKYDKVYITAKSTISDSKMKFIVSEDYTQLEKLNSKKEFDMMIGPGCLLSYLEFVDA